MKEEGKWEVGKRDKAIKAKVRELERWRELEERDRKRNNNVVVKGVELEEGRLKEAVEKLWLKMGMQGGIEKAKQIGRKTGKEKKMVLARSKDRVRKREVMQRKNVLIGRLERIEDDMISKERKMQ